MSRRKRKRYGYSERLSFGVTPEQKRRLEELLRVRAKQGKAQHLTDLLREALNLYLAKQDDIPGTRAAITRRLEGRLDAVEEQLDQQNEYLSRILAFFQRKRGNNG
jgi:CelD/BcsL family acetyltransferase involved in cellulose biosynthesis